MTDVADDPYEHLFHIPASEGPQLFDKKNVALMATLKNRDPVRYETLLARLKANKVPRLTQLEADIGRAFKKGLEIAKLKAAAGGNLDDGFDRDEKTGAPLPSQGNIRLAIEKLGVTLRYDAFAGRPLVEGLEGFGPTLDDKGMNRLWLLVDESFGFRPQLNFFSVVVSDTCLRNTYHPVREYLDGLEWDGMKRLDTWLIDYCGVVDTPYTRAVGRLMLLAAVRRVRTPGSKHDEMLVLESPEGFSKSTLLRELAVHEDWFTDSLPLNVDDKRMIENAAGKWIIENAELQGMRKGDVGKIKAQISRQRDRARLAFERLPSEVDRQCVFFGTVNPAEATGYLASLTGNRRFWPVTVQRIDLEAFRRDRDQLWAEAAMREALGESTRLDEDLWSAAMAQQQKREAPNALYDALVPYLGSREGVIFPEDIWKLLNIPAERRAIHYERFGAAMKALGYRRAKRRRTNESPREWAYVRGDSRQIMHVDRDYLDREPLVRVTDHEVPTETETETEA